MVSNLAMVVFSCALLLNLYLSVWWYRAKKEKTFLNRMFLLLALSLSSWIIPVMCMRFVDPKNTSLMYLLDCLMQPGGALCSPLYLCIAISFTQGYEKMRKWMLALFILPIITVLIAWTNPLHHLYYVEFSVVKSQIVFGPYIYVSGLCNYAFLVTAIVYMVTFALRNTWALYWKQSVLFILSGLCPLLVSVYATFSGADVPISATPMSFIVTVVLNGLAINQLHMLDITPVANRHILEAISDGYLVLSENGLVLTYNKHFEKLFGAEYGIEENKSLSDCVKKEDISQKTAVYNMLTAIESSKEGMTKISYEQAVTTTLDGKAKKFYFIVDVLPLEVNDKIVGFAMLFKDITQLRESMQTIQRNQERMMEQERMAFLGQMIGGLAHNLKTPIMSISGCISATDALVDECEASLSNPQVVEEDYREIYQELRDWFQKVKTATAYMSDIIAAIRGQATNISTDEQSTFTIDEMLKRSSLLMRHELLNSGCVLKTVRNEHQSIFLQGDINNLIQVVNNLLSNAIYAQHQYAGGGEIEIHIYLDNENLNIAIKDRGPGVSPQVKDKLFKAMVTNKGAMGTGLGLYISNVVIKGKFNGSMWMQDREGGGSIFGISIPLEKVRIRQAIETMEE